MFDKKKEVDIEKEVNAVISWMADVGDDLRGIYKDLKKIKELRKRDMDHREDLGKDFHLAEQIKIWDNLLRNYEFLDDDVEINKKRVQMVGKELRRQMVDSKVPEELKKKINTADWWNFRW